MVASLIYNKGFTLTAKSFKHSSFLPPLAWLLVPEDSQPSGSCPAVCCAMLQGKLLLLVLIKYMFSESEWCWWCGTKAHSKLQNHNRKVEIKKKLGLFSFLWVAVQSAGNELTRGRAGGGRTVTLYAVCILAVVFKIFIFLNWLSFLVKCCCCLLSRLFWILCPWVSQNIDLNHQDYC